MTESEQIEILSRAVQRVIMLEHAAKDDGEELTPEECWRAAFSLCYEAWKRVAR